ncbi:glycosyltransferase [Alkalicoccus halolimnae]|uniref:Glycosyltransferase n=1 Tax=Alkalicoccus halolimnae TaxID=1667239 RepID=A0A5C7F7B1_9BACI|nr:glycosyltransferase [Alkalicoccus halolimnae]TXF85460.1 glycosyltransferase [Alkalicoccus halolimnae]
MKKIMFLEARFDSFYGAQKSMLKLIQSLDPNKFECRVMTTGTGRLKKGFEEEHVSVDVVKLGKKANVFGGAALQYSLFSKVIAVLQIFLYNLKVMIYILRYKIDVIYVNDERAFLYSVIAAKVLRRKNVIYIRSEMLGGRFNEAVLKYSSHIITIAEGVLKKIPDAKIEKYRHKISNIYTGFEFEKLKALDKSFAKESVGVSPEKVVVGFLGGISERKGIDLLVDSFIELYPRYENIELLIVGDASDGYEAYWEDQLSKITEGKVNFTHLPFRKNVSEAYSAMDIFVLPSRDEGLPRVVIEAMAHDLPVIATDAGGTQEIITKESLGIIVERTQDSLVEGITRLLEDEKGRATMANQSRKAVRLRFSDEVFKENVNNYFSRI